MPQNATQQLDSTQSTTPVSVETHGADLLSHMNFPAREERTYESTRHPNELFSYTSEQADNIAMGMGSSVLLGATIGMAALYRTIVKSDSQ